MAEEGKDWGNFSATTTLASEYVLRGITQSAEEMAIQGSFDWWQDIFYAGVWASTVDFSPTQASIEIDLYAGITPTFGSVNFNFGILYYLYPGAADQPLGVEFDFYEFVATAEHNFGPVTAQAIVYYTPDYFADSDTGFYLEGKLSAPLVENLEVSGSFAKQWIADNVQFGAPDYLTWNIGLSYSWKQFSLDVRYHDTDLSANGCFGSTTDALCGSRVVGSLIASF